MVTHPCVTRFAGYTVCTTFLSLFLHEPKKNWDQSLNKKHLLLKGCSWLAYDFPNNLYIAVVISRLVLVAGPSFALMNPKYYNITLFFSSWLVIKFFEVWLTSLVLASRTLTSLWMTNNLILSCQLEIYYYYICFYINKCLHI